ncbi:MAG: PfkB family carbohydrate kinase, partial [Chloroflexota bacterium]
SLVEKDANRYIKVNEAGPKISQENLDKLLDLIRDCAEAGDWWVISGSAAPGIRTDIYAEIITHLQSVGAKTILDSSGEVFQNAISAKPYLIKPNAEEASQLVNLPITTFEEAAEAARIIHTMGPSLVAISMDSQGAILSNGTTWWIGRAPKIQEKNPIGAGDSMVAGLVWQLSQGRTLREAIQWGIACGASTASEEGTKVGSLAIVNQLIGEVEIKEFSHAIHS